MNECGQLFALSIHMFSLYILQSIMWSSHYLKTGFCHSICVSNYMMEPNVNVLLFFEGGTV